MSTPLIHPRKQASRKQFYPHTVSISKVDRVTPGTAQSNFVPAPILSNLPCAFSEGKGALPATWQVQTDAGDTILLTGYFPEIKSKMQAKLTIEGTERIFAIKDALADDLASQTMLVVTPV